MPPGRGFLVAAGLTDCLLFLEDFSFIADDLRRWQASRRHHAGGAGLTVTAVGRTSTPGLVVPAV
jgi:hypothetical protein